MRGREVWCALVCLSWDVGCDCLYVIVRVLLCVCVACALIKWGCRDCHKTRARLSYKVCVSLNLSHG